MIHVSASACFLAAVLILLLPADRLLAAVLAGGFHEIGHLLAIYAMGSRVSRVQIRASGTRIYTVLPGYRQEFLCAAAGPLMSLMLLLFCHTAPMLAFFGMIQGMFNLLPVYPLDGGRMLFCLLQWKKQQKAEQICRCVGYAVCGALLLAGLILLLRNRAGFFPLLCWAAVAAKLKIPCKSEDIAVQ